MNPTNDKSLYLLIAASVFLVILSGVFVFWILFGGKGTEDTSGGQAVTFPTGGRAEDVQLPIDPVETNPLSTQNPEDIVTEPIEVINDTNSDWRDEVVEYESADIVADTLPNDVSIEDDYIDPYNTSDLYYKPIPPSSFHLLTPFRPTQPPIITDALLSSAPPQEYTELSESNFTNCGQISVPYFSTEGSMINFISGLDNDRSVRCLGEAIVDDCDGAHMRLSGSISGYLYVSERNDGECGVGPTIEGNDEVVMLCKVEDIMNEARNEYRTFEEWQEVFSEDPGGVFVEAFVSGLTDVNVTNQQALSNCPTYGL